MRLFIGVELDDAMRAAVADAAKRLQQRLHKAVRDLHARWVMPENLHITLWFIGEASEPQTEAIARALQQPPVAARRFSLSVAGCGAFPPSGAPRVFWLGVHDGTEQMQHLHADLATRLAPLGYEAERRKYIPHLTIARVKDSGHGSARVVRRIVEQLPAECGRSAIESITLFRSRLSPKGATYEPLLRVPLS